MKSALYGVLALAQRDWDDHMDLGDEWWAVMMIGMLLFWAVVVVALVWGIRAFTTERRHPPEAAAGESPLAILNRSLAEGKISVEDYERRRRVLTDASSGRSDGGQA
jgi:uncharacterized membrane protein